MSFNPFNLSLHSELNFMGPFDLDSNFLSSLTSKALSCHRYSIDTLNVLLIDMLIPLTKRLSAFHLIIGSLSKKS